VGCSNILARRCGVRRTAYGTSHRSQCRSPLSTTSSSPSDFRPMGWRRRRSYAKAGGPQGQLETRNTGTSAKLETPPAAGAEDQAYCKPKVKVKSRSIRRPGQESGLRCERPSSIQRSPARNKRDKTSNKQKQNPKKEIAPIHPPLRLKKREKERGPVEIRNEGYRHLRALPPSPKKRKATKKKTQITHDESKIQKRRRGHGRRDTNASGGCRFPPPVLRHPPSKTETGGKRRK
jgi:hypothetical protein